MPRTIGFFRASATSFVILLLSIQSNAQPDVKLHWVKGMLPDLYVGLHSVARDGSGDLYVFGQFLNTVDLDPGQGGATFTSMGSEDVFIAKYDASGKYVWAKCLRGSHGSFSSSMSIDVSGNLIITGTFSGTVDMDPGPGTAYITSTNNDDDIFLAKYSPSGDHIWSKAIGTSEVTEKGTSIALDGIGNIYMTGYFDGTTDMDPGPGTSILTGNGNDDIFIAKYDVSGNLSWAIGMGGAGWDWGSSIAVDGGGNLYVTGEMDESFDFDPGPGTSYLTSAGEHDIFLAKYDEAGRFVFARSMGGESYESGKSITLDKNGMLYITGEFNSATDFDPGPGTATLAPLGFTDAFLAKYDASGNYLWAKSMGGDGATTKATAVASDGNGFVYQTGYYFGTVDPDTDAGSEVLTATGGHDVFLSKFDASGNHVLSRSIGGTYEDQAWALTADASGRIHVVGNFQVSADFDPGPGSSIVTGAGIYGNGFLAAYISNTSKTWIGGNGDWSTPANWSDGAAPGSNDVLTVIAGNPRLDVDFTIAGSLTLSGSGGLTVQPGKTLTVTGIADFGARPVIFRSDASGTAQLGTVAGTLTGASLVTAERYIPNTGRRWRLLTAPLDGLTLNAAWQNGQTWNGAVPFAGDGTGTLITGQQQGNASTANGRGFDFWSAIANSSASVMSYTQRSGQGTWSPMANTTWSNAFNSDPAYLLFVRGPRSSTYSTGTSNAGTTLRPTGSLKQGERNIPVDGTKGYTLIGNPYPSQIDFNALYLENGNSSVIKRQLWMWDATAGTSGNFQAVVYSGGKYVEVPAKFHGPGQASPLTAIQSGHGFFVQPLTPSGGTLKILEKHKLTLQPASPNILLSEDRTPRVWLNLVKWNTDGTSLTADGVMASYGENHRMDASDAEDALKLENIQENLAILNDGISLIADARPMSRMQEPIALRTWNLSTGSYRLEAKLEGMEDRDFKAFLEDRHLKTRTPLKMDGGITSIDVDMGQGAAHAEDRFRIVFEKAAVNASLRPEADGEGRTMTVYPNPLTGRTLNVRLQNLPAGEYTLQLVGSDGRIVATKKVRHDEGASVHRIELNGILPKGAYQVVCLLGHDRVDTKKLIAK